MDPIFVITCGKPDEILDRMKVAFLKKCKHHIELDLSKIKDFTNKKLLFVVQLEEFGISTELDKVIKTIYNSAKSNQLDGSTGAILIRSKDEMYTKTISSLLILRLNSIGMSFMGRPMVEAPGELRNFTTAKKTNGLSLEANLIKATENLAERFVVHRDNSFHGKNKILVIHGSSEGSNTLHLWRESSKYLSRETKIIEYNIQKGYIEDCKGCSYKICKHYAMQKTCFYGDVMVQEVYPEILNAEAIVLLCPNYNDALTANLTALINRLSALFRQNRFYKKRIYAVIVSGSSGSEAIGMQVIRSMNMNKTFYLPPYFMTSAIANDRGSILELEDLEEKAKLFANRLIL